MQRSRTIKTLGALLASLTIGTFVLLALETRPASVGGILPLVSLQDRDEAVLSAVRNTAVPVLQEHWVNIVVHDSICDMSGSPEDCHFIIENGQVRPTQRWIRQARGNHIVVPGHDFNAVSIGICLIGDLAVEKPSPHQMKALKSLTRILQRKLGIQAQHIYMHGDLAACHCPGSLFPLAEYRSQLLTAPF